jgi:hypothetical protein
VKQSESLEMPNSRRPTHRRWFRYSLRTLLVAMTIVSLGIGWWVNSARRQQKAIAQINSLVDLSHSRVSVFYDYQTAGPRSILDWGEYYRTTINKNGESWLPPKVLSSLGQDFFHNVSTVYFSGGSFASTASEGLANGSHPMDESVLKDVGALVRLSDLSIDFPVTDAGVAHLANLRGLRSLEISNASGLTDESLRILSRLPRLEALRLFGCQFTDHGLAHLSAMRQLKLLNLNELHNEKRDSGFTSDGVAQLSKLSNLEALSLSFPTTQSVADGIGQLAALKRLRMIDLIIPTIADADVRFLPSLPELEEINLARTNISGTCLQDLGGLRKLRVLLISNTRVSDETIPYLVKLPALEAIYVSRTSITLEALEQFQRCPTLRKVSTSRKVGSLKQLKQALPNCEVN